MSPEARRRYEKRRRIAAWKSLEWLCYAALVIYGAAVFASWVHGV